MSDRLVEIVGLEKTFHLGLRRKRVEAVRGVSFGVERGEIFGFLGPNGAGKTTTMKTLLGLIAPTAGKVRLFGEDGPRPEALRRVGFLPENPYFYDYLRPAEFMDLCGRLFGLSRAERRRRGGELLDRMGLRAAADRPIRGLSKGMLQRLGIAQALVNDPELLVLDEPMTGLDPIGRKEIRDLIVSQRARGKTIFFSSHILSDVELLCDRVAIVDRGKLVDAGPLSQLLRPEVRHVEIEVAGVEPDEALRKACHECATVGSNVRIVVAGENAVEPVLRLVLDRGGRVLSVTPKRETLEDLFVRRAVGTGE